MGRYFYLALLAFVQHAMGDVEPFINDARYDAGDYGVYPTKTYHTSSIISPRLNMVSMNEKCRDGSFTMITPRGVQVPKGVAAGPMILDDAGDLVWTQVGWGSGDTYGLTVQEYKGKNYLTFWAGDDSVKGHGEGIYYMLDEHYEVAYKLDGLGGLKGDLHELKITPEGTALMTIYQIVQVETNPDHKYFGGWIWECILQEVNIETNELVFEWHASEHYDIFDSYSNDNPVGSRNSPFDFFHMNSIEKDIWGNYLVSSRYMHTLTYIEGKTGNVLWVMGGKRNTFTDLSDGKAVSFKWQHHARWHNNYTQISLFDNGADYHHTDAPISRGMLLGVDKDAQTASFITEYINPTNISSNSQGSVQVRENGNVLVGYGYNGAWTEFANDGTPLCETHFGASSQWNTGSVQSYRVFKHKWVGYPVTKPALSIVNKIAYVSWNGATEVVHWMVQGSMQTEAGAEFYGIKSIEKLGFETGISLDGITGDIRIAALDINGDILGITDAVTFSVATEMSHQGNVSDEDLLPLQMLVGIMTFVMMIMVCRECVSCMKRRKARAMGRVEGNDDEEFLLSRGPAIEVTQAD